MNIVIDSNVLFSALIKESTTRKVILEYDGLFLFPALLFDEAQEHLGELIVKSGMSSSELKTLFNLILTKTKVIGMEMLYAYREEALGIVKDIDLDDALLVACALAFPNSVIWSNDKRLKMQTKVKVLSTGEILKFLK